MDIGFLLQRGVSAHRAGHTTQAKNAYLKVLDAMPREPNANRLLGAVFLQEGQLDRARKHLEVALKSAPGDADSFYFLGRVYAEEKNFAEAATQFLHCLEINPRHLNARIALAIVRAAQRELQAALEDLDTVLMMAPGTHDALVNKINILMRLNRNDDAWETLNGAIRRFPQSVDLRFKRGELHLVDRNLEGALRDFREVMKVRPDDRQALARLNRTRADLCDWPDDGDLLAVDGDVENADALRDLQLGLHTIAWKASPAIIRSVSSRGWEQVEVPPRPPVRSHAPGDRLRIGYVSSDLRSHAVGFLAADLFRDHDKSAFDIVNYSTLPDDPDDAVRQNIQANCSEVHFVDGIRGQAFADLVASHRIDVLVDVNGFTMHSYLGEFARRPAPVQMTYLGFPGTTGAPFIDYIIGDPSVTPVGSDGEFTEKVIRLPDTYQPNSSQRRPAATAPSRAECGLPETGFVFCCFNASYKITDDVFDSWARILSQVDGSVLWLLSRSDTVKENLRKEATRRNIDPDRLVFAPSVPNPEHLARHAHANLFLDTFYYGAHTTASDALWMGVPVVTKIGPTFAGRVGASLDRAAGLPDLVTETQADYEALAVSLARDPARLKQLRQHLATERDHLPLFDSKRYTRHLERAYVMAFERAARGEEPSAFDVPLLTA